MKVIYEFDPEDVDDRNALKIVQGANDYYSCLWDIYNKCRHTWKYEERASEDRVKLAEEVAEMINEMTNVHEIS